MVKIPARGTAPAVIATTVLLSVVLLLAIRSRADLPAQILRTGRIVLSSPTYSPPLQDRGRIGEPSLVLDGNPHTATALQTVTPGGASPYLLVDVGLSHDGPAKSPRARVPKVVLISSGACADCSPTTFRRFGRAKEVRMELYGRQANNPDREFRHMPPRLLASWPARLRDQQGPQRVDIPTVTTPHSPGYPENVLYYSIKIVVLSTFPGQHLPQTVAFAEVLYGDAPVDGETESGIRFWR